MKLTTELRFRGYMLVRRLQRFRPWFATKLPQWLITDALIHASCNAIRSNETVPDVLFVDVYERWCKEGRG